MEFLYCNHYALPTDFSGTLERLKVLGVDIIPTSLVTAMTLSRLQSSWPVMGRESSRRRSSLTLLNQLDAQPFQDEDRAVTFQKFRYLNVQLKLLSDLQSALRRSIFGRYDFFLLPFELQP